MPKALQPIFMIVLTFFPLLNLVISVLRQYNIELEEQFDVLITWLCNHNTLEQQPKKSLRKRTFWLIFSLSFQNKQKSPPHNLSGQTNSIVQRALTFLQHKLFECTKTQVLIKYGYVWFLPKNLTLHFNFQESCFAIVYLVWP